MCDQALYVGARQTIGSVNNWIIQINSVWHFQKYSTVDSVSSSIHVRHLVRQCSMAVSVYLLVLSLSYMYMYLHQLDYDHSQLVFGCIDHDFRNQIFVGMNLCLEEEDGQKGHLSDVHPFAPLHSQKFSNISSNVLKYCSFKKARKQ